MKKACLPCVVVCLLVCLSAIPAVIRQGTGGQEISIKIEPDQTKVAPAFEGSEPPTFTVETEPGAAVSIMVATGFDLFVIEKGQSIGKFFITYYGSESAGIPPTVLKADEQGRLTYTLPTRVFEAMSEGPRRIYYVAEVIEAQDADHYNSLGASFDYESGKAEDAPYIAIEESPRIAEAQEHFKTGQAHYTKKEYAAAANEFNEAMILYPNPAFEYNMGMCHLRLGLQYLSAAVAAGRFSAEEDAKIKKFIASVEDSISMK